MIREKFFHARILAVTAFFFIACGPAFTGSAAAASRGAPQRPSGEQREFASFVDGFLAGVQRENGAPGMAISAVRDGEILYLKGY